VLGFSWQRNRSYDGRAVGVAVGGISVAAEVAGAYAEPAGVEFGVRDGAAAAVRLQANPSQITPMIQKNRRAPKKFPARRRIAFENLPERLIILAFRYPTIYPADTGLGSATCLRPPFRKRKPHFSILPARVIVRRSPHPGFRLQMESAAHTYRAIFGTPCAAKNLRVSHSVSSTP
jgi:hypothetical protein